MPDTMTPGIGHNAPPLTELLREETADLSSRSADLLGAVGRCAVSDEDTAGRATTLAQMLGAHFKTVEARRTDRKAPFLEAGKQVDGHFKLLTDPLDAAKRKVVGMIDAYRREQDRLAAVERQRLENEARKASEEAAAAAASATTVEQEVAAEQKQAQAVALAEEAKATTAAPIVSDYGGKAIARTVWKHEIEDPLAVFKYLLKTDKPRAVESVSEIVGRLVRAGVREIPGAKIYSDTATTIR